MMKKSTNRRSMFWLIILATIFLGIWGGLRSRKAPIDSSDHEVIPEPESFPIPDKSKATNNSTEDEKPNDVQENIQAQGGTPAAYYSRDTPIEFFGKVVDEQNHPVPGVSVSFGWLDSSPTEYSTATTSSDSDGFFNLSSVRGKALDVSLQKEGYYVVRKGHRFTFEYSNPYETHFYLPDSNNPVVFYLRKKGEGAQLITSVKGMRRAMAISILPDGVPTSINLLNRSVGAAGQIVFSFQKTIGQATTSAGRVLQLQVPDGGLIECEDEFPFEAPETGYEGVWNSQLSDNKNQQTRIEKSFYIKFGNPARYGRIHVKANTTSSTVYLEYAMNPSGSRNLEPK